MKKITLEITGAVPLGGHRPGERFRVDAHDDGTPVDRYWRRRLADEAAHRSGAVRVVPIPSPAPADEAAAPAPAAKKGR